MQRSPEVTADMGGCDFVLCTGLLGMRTMVGAPNAYEKGRNMQIMGTNRWDRDMDARMLVASALEFADMVRQQGIAELHGAWIAEDQKLMWCTWDTEDLPALQAAFDDMNRQTGLASELTDVKTFYSTVQETASV